MRDLPFFSFFPFLLNVRNKAWKILFPNLFRVRDNQF